MLTVTGRLNKILRESTQGVDIPKDVCTIKASMCNVEREYTIVIEHNNGYVHKIKVGLFSTEKLPSLIKRYFYPS